MTDALLLYVDSEIRSVDLDVARDDVLCHLIGSPQTTTIDLDDLRLRLILDGLGYGSEGPLNLTATALLYGSGRRPAHPIVGTVLVLGLTVDGDPTDVPDDLVNLF